MDVEIYRTGYYGGAGRAAVLDRPRRPGRSRSRPARPTTSSASPTARTGRVSTTLTTTSALDVRGLPAARRARVTTAPTTRSCSSSATTRVARTCSTASPSAPFRPTTTTAASRCTSATPAARTPRQRVAGGQGVLRPPLRAAKDSNSVQKDWFTAATRRGPSWLERSGYDVTYDVGHRPRARAGRQPCGLHLRRARRVLVGRRCARPSPRRATPATNLLFGGANEAYWRVRFEASPRRAPPTASWSVTRPRRAPRDRSERHLDEHVARSGRAQPAGERAGRRAVRR